MPLYKATTQTDEFTEAVTKWFDLEFNGESEFIGWEKPTVPDEYSIGLIVGPSGSGKSLLLREFGKEEHPRWHVDKAVVSHFATPDEAIERLMATGLNDVRAFVRPHHVLSTGEQFRSDLARRLKNGAVIDEFTSTVNRSVAKAASKAVRRYINKKGLKNIVFASCHDDILEWLQPDWYFDTRDGTLHDGRLLQCPPIEITIYPCRRSYWKAFANHHYLNQKIGSSARCFLATAKFDGVENIVGFSASLPLPSGTLKNAWREHRTVILPDFQGLGIGPRVSDAVAGVHKREGKRYYSKTAHPRFGGWRDAHTDLWKPTGKYNPKSGKKLQRFKPAPAEGDPNTMRWKNMINKFGGDLRQTFSHEYIGP